VTLCSMCFNTLKRANLRVKQNADDMKKINDLMYREEDYQGHVKVLHFLELLRDIGFGKVKRTVKKNLRDLKIAPYYGCMILRPKEVSIDDPEAPTILDEVLDAIGAEVVRTPYNKVCCGSYQTVQDKYTVAELAHDILGHAKRAGADAVATTCPLCAFNLDNRQKEVVQKHPGFEQIPIFYITQLMALAFDLAGETYGFDQNYVDPAPLLKKKNLLKK
jgi:heterodisulfide reductase subunit B